MDAAHISIYTLSGDLRWCIQAQGVSTRAVCKVLTPCLGALESCVCRVPSRGLVYPRPRVGVIFRVDFVCLILISVKYI